MRNPTTRPRADALDELLDELLDEITELRTEAEMWRRMRDFVRRHRKPVFPD
jgi:hypothetical protein